METLTLRHTYGLNAITRKIVMANIVSEQSLPYSLAAMDTPDKCYEMWQSVVAKDPEFEPEKERLVVFLLNTRFSPFAWHTISVGTVSDATAHPRETLRPVIASNAYAFIIMHNHPSGDPSPSRADEVVTKRMNEAAAIMQVKFLDHAIIGKPSPGRSPYYSFREAGYICN